ncbi:MAG: hypothetical protein CMN64_18255 [Sphingobium sp.]|jgi:hypothetical protein|nr:hypothetical protein [Sphingobium sp.]|tara:strand:- start:1473 stop:1706 length:234 start_codon:yes stop_codon:yes gene_type:complete
MSYANKLSSFELSFLLRATTAHALRVTIPMPAPGVLRAGGGSWLALPGSLALPLRRCAVPAHHRRPCSVRPGVPTTT